MTRSDLFETDKNYKEHVREWELLEAAYNGFESLLALGLLSDFENSHQYKQVGRGLGFSYSAQVVELTTGFIAQSDFISVYDKMNGHPPWDMFMSDCDLLGTDFDNWWNEVRDIAAVFGWVGILTTQPAGGNPAHLMSKGVYPYVSIYRPLDILERKWSRDPVTARPVLSYIKLRQYDPDTILEWSLDEYKTWDVSGENPVLVDEMSGPNALGEIPFTFFFCIRKPGSRWDGVSLIKHVAPIDANIVRSAVRADRIEHMAAFPMFVRPKPELFDKNKTEQEAGPGEVFQFDPETPSAKPYWLAPEADKALGPIMESWKLKKQEIYEMAFLQSLRTASDSKESRSGDAHKQVFRFLEARLSKMVISECEARRSVIRYWLKWQNMSERFEEIIIDHTRRFDVEQFIAAIEDMLTEDAILGQYSPTARTEIRKRLVEIGSLRSSDGEVKKKIYDEIGNAGSGMAPGIPTTPSPDTGQNE